MTEAMTFPTICRRCGRTLVTAGRSAVGFTIDAGSAVCHDCEPPGVGAAAAATRPALSDSEAASPRTVMVKVREAMGLPPLGGAYDLVRGWTVTLDEVRALKRAYDGARAAREAGREADKPAAASNGPDADAA